MLTGEATHALAFRAEHPRHRVREISGVEVVFRIRVGAHDPDVALLQLAQGPGQVGDREERHGLRGAAGHLADDGGEPHGAILGSDHRIHACSIRNAQARAQVVRVLDAVEHQQEGWPLHRIERVVQAVAAGRLRHACDDPLVAPVAGQAIEPLAGRGHYAHALFCGELQQVAHSPVGALAGGMQFDDGLRPLAQQHGQRMEPEDNPCLAHLSTGTRSILRVSRSTRTSLTFMRSARR